MRSKKILSVVIAICIMLVTVSIPESVRVSAESNTVFQVNNSSQLIKGKTSSIEINLNQNNNTISGMEFFVAFDTDAFSVSSVTSTLSEEWELDWKEKEDAKYGKGILCMIQDSTTKGISDTNIDVIKIKISDVNAQANKTYEFKLNVIDVCDSDGNSMKSSVSSIDGSFVCLTEPEITISDAINIQGFQISHLIGGLRTVSSVEPEIAGQEVVEFGNIYAIVKDGVTAKDMYIGSENLYIAQYKATELGIIKNNFSDSSTAINYVRTMTENGTTSEAFTQSYMIRAYAKLADGSYVYSKACSYSIYQVAKVLYDNAMMSTSAGHDYLYNSILKIVDSNYQQVDYNWNNIIVKP